MIKICEEWPQVNAMKNSQEGTEFGLDRGKGLVIRRFGGDLPEFPGRRHPEMPEIPDFSETPKCPICPDFPEFPDQITLAPPAEFQSDPKIPRFCRSEIATLYKQAYCQSGRLQWRR
jgi:hypothetical protein